MSEKQGNDDSGIGYSPLSLKLEGERSETSSLQNCFQQSSTESTNLNYSELTTETAFQKRGDVDHVFTGSVKCELCEFRPMRLFQYYHHIIIHCKRSDSDCETDPAQALNIESFHDRDNASERIHNKKKKRRKNIKPKRCKIRDCDFLTTEGSDVTEAKKELWMHMRKNHKHPLVCRLCPFVTEPKHHMVYHWLGDHTKLRPFKCEEPDCSYSCVAKSMLNSHMVRHWKVHQYNCMDCHFKARLLHAMKKHMREKNHTHVVVLNEDGTPNLTAVIDIHSKKRGPRRNASVKNQDKSDQSDLNQSSSSASPEPSHRVSHSETQQELQSAESDVNGNNDQLNLSMIYTFHMLHHLSNYITNSILNWKENTKMVSWDGLHYMFNRLYNENIIPQLNMELMDPINPLETLFYMQKMVEASLNNINSKFNRNVETINNTGAGPSNDRDDANHINKLLIFNKVECQPKTQNTSTIGSANFETADSEAGPSDYKKYTNQASTSNKRKAKPEEPDNTAMTGNNYYNNETSPSNKISNEISTFEEVESQSQVQKDKIPNKPVSSISKFKSSGANKRKGKAQPRFAVEKNIGQSKIESFESPIDSEHGSQRESQINVTVNDVNLNNSCEYCDLAFGNKFMHVMHMHFHNVNDPYTCNACGERCANSLDFNSHLIRGKH